MAEDRISQLSDRLIHHIFSFLPTVYLVRMSLVSKRWRHVWVSAPFIFLEDFKSITFEKKFKYQYEILDFSLKLYGALFEMLQALCGCSHYSEKRQKSLPPLPNLKHLNVDISARFTRNSDLRESLHWCAPSVETLEIFDEPKHSDHEEDSGGWLQSDDRQLGQGLMIFLACCGPSRTYPTQMRHKHDTCILDLFVQQLLGVPITQGYRKLFKDHRKLLKGHRKLLESRRKKLKGRRNLLGGPTKLLEAHRKLLKGHKKLLKVCRKLVKSSRKMLQSRRKFLEGRTKLLKNLKKLLEGHRKLLEEHRKLQGYRKLLEYRRKLLDSCKKLLEDHRKLLESRRNLLEPHKKLLKSYRKLLEGHRKLVYGYRKLYF
ncbi:hypothetical protein FNV43_RR01682 [Rhamnella rubrinervis]|uniref:F-box domain-containing protein n=1 Tax=Rhamnella rubrinervis TaxID=2594499 RepID=A0A8K0MTI2_9ROSA|nr:hypothetical protein FNV43_RR01682 [Rhamnella rubrinervis]